MLMKPCIVCGEPCETGRCSDHASVRRPPRASRAVGYDHAWDKLSLRARRLQPWCSDCGATRDLTTDHTRRAWERKAAGLQIRIEDVDVVCRPCNSRRGKARPDEEPLTWGEGAPEVPPEGERQAESRSHTPGGIR